MSTTGANDAGGVDRWDSWGDAMSLHDAMDRLLNQSMVASRAGRSGARQIPVDMREEDDRYLVLAALPGIRPEDLHVDVRGDILTIHGEAQPDEGPTAPERSGRDRWLMRERRPGPLSRAIRLPSTVDADRADASYEHGILTISLPKIHEAAARTIPVGASTRQAGHTLSQPQPGFHGPAETAGERTVYSPIQAEAVGTPPTTTSAGTAHPQVHGQSPSDEPARVTPGMADTTSGRTRIERSMIKEGMEVVGPDMSHVGSVKDVRERDFLCDRSLARDIYIPFDGVLNVTGTRVVLAIQAGQVDDMAWERPSVGL